MHQHIYENAEKILMIIQYIEALNCALQTLQLSINLSNRSFRGFTTTRYYEEDEDIFSAGFNIASSPTLVKAVCDLNVETKIKLAITSNHEENCMPFEHLATRIGVVKQWTISLQQSIQS